MISILKANSTLPGLKWAMFMLPELHTFIREGERERERRGGRRCTRSCAKICARRGQGDRETVKKEEK